MDEMQAPRCARCGGDMVLGVIVDRGDYSARFVPTWVPGAPRKGWLGGLKPKGGPEVAIVTFRCEGCGVLESYAPSRLPSTQPRD